MSHSHKNLLAEVSKVHKAMTFSGGGGGELHGDWSPLSRGSASSLKGGGGGGGGGDMTGIPEEPGASEDVPDPRLTRQVSPAVVFAPLSGDAEVVHLAGLQVWLCGYAFVWVCVSMWSDCGGLCGCPPCGGRVALWDWGRERERERERERDRQRERERHRQREILV